MLSCEIGALEPDPMLTPDLLRGINALPTLPGVLTQIVQTLEDEWASAKELESIIKNDQALSSKMLAAANSAYYGFPQQVTTVQRAAMVLGFDEVRKICLGAGLAGFLGQAKPRHRLEYEQMWRHSLWVAEAAALLATEVPGRVEPDSEGAFTAGLLHDLGKVVLVAFFPDAAATVFELMTREGLSWRQAELRLDLDHQDVGLYLAEHWNLPPMLGEVMGRHHAPDPKLHYEPLVLLVHLADWVVHQLQEGLEGASRMPELLPEASARLGLTPADLTRCQESLLARADSLDQLWQSFQN